ncbi:urease accessory protein UreE [Mesobaculum littorinae]|uniref:Urease accessory protein UreE n=1 Tax=Mesobaculum littorinae TaxID=2486419 RepID=A0A438AJM3_9RHOB|nr:urease accessory protein UreE [Mesobaculum littorinae]RVV98846.1 urease accessory protein UreE [Mesobaculum littorinae]
MTDLPRAHVVLRRDGLPASPGQAGPQGGRQTTPHAAPTDHIEMDYEARFLRRRRVTTAAGEDVLVDLPETTDLRDGDALVLDDGRHIAVVAACEPLLEVRGPSLARLAWHIGNRHTPCEVRADCLRLQADHVLAQMLSGLGADLREVSAPFTPEGGAYGTGRTLPHSHGPGEAAEHHRHSHGASGAAEHHHTHSHAAGGDTQVAPTSPRRPGAPIKEDP